MLEQGVGIVSIASDRVVLRADGRSITLLLSHGAEQVSRRLPAPPRFPPADIDRGRR